MKQENLENPNHVAGCQFNDCKVYCVCDECGCDIYYGEYYYKVEHRKYCSSCVEEHEADD